MSETKTPKLSAAQQRVLDAAARGELTYSQSSGGKDSKYSVDGKTVNEITMHVLMHQHRLLVGPTLQQKMGRPFEMKVKPNEAGQALVTKEDQ